MANKNPVMYGTKLNARIETSTYDLLVQRAKKERKDVSEIVRHILKKAVES